jgi:hypothetical protein
MKPAPARLEKKVVKAACLYRDSQDTTPIRVQQRFYDKFKKAWNELVVAMECRGSEDLMVHENLMSIVARTPRKILTPGKDY